MNAAILELLASRICHDLISPVGAVHNGVEFLEEMGTDAGSEAIALIAHSAKQAAAKLQAFRLAYGAGGRDPNIKPEDIKEVFENLIEAEGKVTQDWDANKLSVESIKTGQCKMLMGMLMLAQEALPKGGTIRVTSDDHQLHVHAESPNVNLRPQVKEALARSLSPEDLDPRLVHPFALSLLADHYGFTLEIGHEEDGRVVFSLG